MLKLVILGLLLSGTLARHMEDHIPTSDGNNSMSNSKEVNDDWTKACTYDTSNCTVLPLQFASRGIKVYIDTDDTSALFHFGFVNSSTYSYIGTSGWSKEGVYIEGCEMKSFENISITNINGLWDYFINDNAISVWLNATRVLYYQFEECASRYRNQTLIPLFSKFPEATYWKYSKDEEDGKDEEDESGWAEVINSDKTSTKVLPDFATRGVSVYVNTDNTTAVRTIIVFNQTSYIGFVALFKEGGFLDGCGYKGFSSGNVGSTITGLWSSYITSKKIIVQFNYATVIDYDFEECAKKWMDQDISGIMFHGFNENSNKDYYKYAKNGSEKGEKDTDNGTDIDRTCSEGQGEIEIDGKKTCKYCDIGKFGWNGKCTACPPGKSTVKEGSTYEDCIDNRYIMCHLDDWGYSCNINYCPCYWGWESCRDGRCYKMRSSSVLDVHIAGYTLLVTTMIALF